MSNVIKLVNTVDQFQNNLLTNCTNFIISHFLQNRNFCDFFIPKSKTKLSLGSMINVELGKSKFMSC